MSTMERRIENFAAAIILSALLVAGCAVSPVANWNIDYEEVMFQVGPEGKLMELGTADEEKSTLPEKPALRDCIAMALEMHASGRIADANIEIAEAQLARAQSAYWPRISLSTRFIHTDEDQYFIQEGQPLDLGGSTSAMADAIALAQVVNMGLPAQPGNPAFDAAYAAAKSQTLQMLQTTSLPDMEIKYAGRNFWTSSLDLVYPVFTGGKISAVNEKAKVGLKFAHSRRAQTDHKIITRVTKMYQSVLMTQEMLKLGKETLTRFEVILDITERVYKGGSGTVKKTDYLKNKVFVSIIEGQVAVMELNLKMSKAGLLNSMGLDPATEIELADKGLKFDPRAKNFDELVEQAFASRPEWEQVSLGVKAAHASIKEAKSDYYPKVALFGNIGHLENDYDHGITDWIRNSWAVGVGVEMPVFNGFETRAAVREARARLRNISETRQLLENGIRTQVKTAHLKLEAAKAQIESAQKTLDDARENRELNIKAYEVELVETQDVIESQLMESFAKAGYFKAIYDYNIALAELMMVTGNPSEE